MKGINILNYVLIVCFTALSLPVLQGQSCPAPPPKIDTGSLVGSWEGHYSLDGKLYPLTLRIQLRGDKLAATADGLTALNVRNVNFNTWLCNSNELHLRLDLADGRVLKLIGQPEGSDLSGRLVYYPEEGHTEREVFALQKALTLK